MKKIVSLVVAIALVSVALFAQTAALSKTANKPVADGIISAGEYPWSQALRGGGTVYASLGKDNTLYLALSYPTAGWVGIGTGTGRMDGSRITMASDVAGAKKYAEVVGMGHSVSPAADSILTAKAVMTKAGTTVLEEALPLAKAGAGAKLQVIVAWSDSTDFGSRHSMRGSLSIPLN